jgi:hypothetical protein
MQLSDNGRRAMLESFTVETFSGHVGEAFRIHPGASNPLDVELISATGLGEESESSGSDRRQPFSIVFRGPGNLLLPQRIYRMEHAEIGSFELFLVPIGPDDKGHRYEAIFT